MNKPQRKVSINFGFSGWKGLALSDSQVLKLTNTLPQSERSHEENQERAYIAASRRADRSIEARVQSAKMASNIHKKRTGKGFRITEEIVIKEEMYEEEDDDLPRSYRLLGPHMQTDSAELNSRVEAYLSNRLTMSALLARTDDTWRENEINRLFAQSFPNLGQRSQDMSQPQVPQAQPSQAMPGSFFNAQPQSPGDRPALQSISYIPRSKRRDRTQSRTSSRSDVTSSRDSAMSPGALTPGSSRDTPAPSMATPNFESAMGVGSPDYNDPMNAGTPRFDSTMGPGTPGLKGTMGAATPLGFGSRPSPFTAELPAEAKMLLGGMTDADSDLMQSVYGPQFSTLGQYYDPNEIPTFAKADESNDMAMFGGEYFGDDAAPVPSLKWEPSGNSMTEESWNTFIDDAAWRNDQQ